MNNDKKYMRFAIHLAIKGAGKVNPNPLVGAVVVKEDRIIGMGYHEKYGEAHAERNALSNCVQSPEGAVLYVTLEPCCHYGKTPPCTDAIIESGIKKVVIGTLDSNEKVAGKGVETLQKAGIEVVIGLCEKECMHINEIFFHYIKHNTPYVMMKYAMTLDGKISTVANKSKWITSALARENVHIDRNKYSAIMVGVNTIIVDDSRLDCRIENSRNPIRIICDSNLRTPINSYVVQTADKIQTIIVTTCLDQDLYKPYIENNCEIITTSKKDGRVDLKELMQILGDKGIDSIILEGGATLNFSAIQDQIVHKVQAYIAPKIFGGDTAKTPVGGSGFLEVDNGVKLINSKVSRFNEDILVESEVEYCLPEL
ncbi:MAG: riboflavin biosynthesis protein RibD [Epulopiscium sp. Nuni2H_MBin003]|nr:MAG: riboflavin biosynthesis protein RibD [Epulopiscium sp. Nuni2H_MBin003]